ncbi:MAG: hypothetical protein FD163_1872 [Hyphomonadaceae bacterium]|nr:MAG: hypothetical protein FD163_1872 [Hyphomonadaceae bacterium]
MEKSATNHNIGKASAILAATASLTLALGIQANAQTTNAPSATGTSPSTEASKITPKTSTDSLARATGQHIKVEIEANQHKHQTEESNAIKYQTGGGKAQGVATETGERTSSQHKETMRCDQMKMDAMSHQHKMDMSAHHQKMSTSNQEKMSTQMKTGGEMSSQQKKIAIEATNGENCFDVSNQHKMDSGGVQAAPQPTTSDQHKH